jgi:hypothetical protein
VVDAAEVNPAPSKLVSLGNVEEVDSLGEISRPLSNARRAASTSSARPKSLLYVGDGNRNGRVEAQASRPLERQDVLAGRAPRNPRSPAFTNSRRRASYRGPSQATAIPAHRQRLLAEDGFHQLDSSCRRIDALLPAELSAREDPFKGGRRKSLFGGQSEVERKWRWIYPRRHREPNCHGGTASRVQVKGGAGDDGQP